MCLYAACTCKLPRTRRARATHMPRTVRQVSDLHHGPCRACATQHALHTTHLHAPACPRMRMPRTHAYTYHARAAHTPHPMRQVSDLHCNCSSHATHLTSNPSPNPNPHQVSDLHCNCSFRNLFGSPLPFAVLEEELPIGNLTAEHFQVAIFAIVSVAIVGCSDSRGTAYSYMQL